MNDFIIEVWFRVNYMFSEGGEIYFFVDVCLMFLVRELLESWYLWVKFFDCQGCLFVEDDEQMLQLVYVLISSDYLFQVCCEFCYQLVGKKLDILIYLMVDILVVKNDLWLVFCVVLDSIIVLMVWL